MINRRDPVQALLDLPMEGRARVWCALNRFEWPKELEPLKPEGWDMMQPIERMNSPEGVALWRAANEHTTHKECLREWNRERMTDVEFELWWASKCRPRRFSN